MLIWTSTAVIMHSSPTMLLYFATRLECDLTTHPTGPCSSIHRINIVIRNFSWIFNYFLGVFSKHPNPPISYSQIYNMWTKYWPLRLTLRSTLNVAKIERLTDLKKKTVHKVLWYYSLTLFAIYTYLYYFTYTFILLYTCISPLHLYIIIYLKS